MKKDIEIPIAENVCLAAVHEASGETSDKQWTTYLLNTMDDPMEMVMVVSKGYEGETKTSTMRHGMRVIDPGSYAKVELITDDVLELTNEFFVTFFSKGKLYERKFIFSPGSISEDAMEPLPVMDCRGVLAQ